MKKKIAALFLAAAMVLSLNACGGNNDTHDVSQPSKQAQAVTITDNWHGTYHSTNGDREIVLTVTGEGGAAEIDGSPVELTSRAEHDREIQMTDSEGSVYHLTLLSDNPVDKRYDFAVTAKDNSSQMIVINTFMQRDDDAVAAAPPSSDNSHGSDAENSQGQGSNTAVFPFLDITYKAPDYDGTLIFQRPNEEGYPTEIVIDGDTYTLDVFAVSYHDPAKDVWNCGGNGSGPKGEIGFSVEGNNTKWLLRVAGGFDFVSEYFFDETQSGAETSNPVGNYSFIGTVYKNEDLDLTFSLQKPNANGYPTEIVLNGVTYQQQTKEMPWLEIANSSLSTRSGALDLTIHHMLIIGIAATIRLTKRGCTTKTIVHPLLTVFSLRFLICPYGTVSLRAPVLFVYRVMAAYAVCSERQPLFGLCAGVKAGILLRKKWAAAAGFSVCA